MARPIKKGLDYFPLDCTMDDEVNLIIADFGMIGYGVLISMFQTIYGSNGYYAEWTIREQKLFSRKVGVELEKVIEIINECLSWGIFNYDKFNDFNILTSRRIQEHYSTATYKRTGVEMIEKYLLVNISDKKHVNNVVTDDGNSPTTKVSDDKSTQSKVKESKEKKSNENNMYIDLYEYYLSLDLIKHKQYTGPMKKAIDKAVKELGVEVEEMKRMLKRHEKKVKESTGEYKTKVRGLAEFFGQKKYGSVELICSDYSDDIYEKEKPKKKIIKTEEEKPWMQSFVPNGEW